MSVLILPHSQKQTAQLLLKVKDFKKIICHRRTIMLGPA